MVKTWIEDIRIKTKHMNREQKTEYVLTYYWYHILLFLLFLGLCLLIVYHIGWGRREKDFSLILVNQEADAARDRAVREEFSEFSGISPERITVDSDYLISYGDVKLQGVNESSYEKFFFNWSAGELDAMIMPESFYHYCISQGGEFADLSQIMGEQEQKRLSGSLYEDQGVCRGLLVSDARLSDALDPDDPIILVFAKEMNHEMSCRSFLEYLCSVRNIQQVKEEP